MTPQGKGYTLRPPSQPTPGNYSIRRPEPTEEELLEKEYREKLEQARAKANQPKPFNPIPSPLERYTGIRQSANVWSDESQFGNATTQAEAEKESEFSWTEQALRTIPAVGGSILGGIAGLPAALPTVGGSLVGGAMAGGAAGAGIGTFLGNWYAGRKTTPKELLVESAVGAIPPILKPAKFAGQGLSAIAKYGARTAGRSALEGAAVSGAATPFQHWAQTGSFDAPIESYGKNIGAGALLGGTVGGGIGTLYGRRLNRLANTSAPTPSPVDVTSPASDSSRALALYDPKIAAQNTPIPRDVSLDFGPPPAETPDFLRTQRPDVTVPTPELAKSREFARIDAQVATKVHELELQQSIAKRNGDWGEVARLDIEILTTKTDASALKRNYNAKPPEFSAMPETQGGLDFGGSVLAGERPRPSPFDFTPRGRRPGTFEARPEGILPPDRGVPPGTEIPTPERPLARGGTPEAPIPSRPSVDKEGRPIFRRASGQQAGKTVVGDNWPLPEGTIERTKPEVPSRQLDRIPDEARGRERDVVEAQALRDKVTRQPDSPARTSTLERLDRQIKEKAAARAAEEAKTASDRATILEHIKASERVKISGRYPHIAARSVDDAIMRGITDTERANILERGARAAERAERVAARETGPDTSTPEGRKAAADAANIDAEIRAAEEVAGIKSKPEKGTSAGMFNLQEFYERLRDTEMGRKLADKLSKARFHIIDIETGRPLAGRSTLAEAQEYAENINENLGTGAARYQVMDNETGTPIISSKMKPFVPPTQRPAQRAVPPKAEVPTTATVEKPKAEVPKPPVVARAEVTAPKPAGRAPIPSPDYFEDVTARNWAERVAEFDKKGAPDLRYRDILSTGSKDELKRGETWRGRVVRYIEMQEQGYQERNKKPEVKFEPKKGVTPERASYTALKNRLDDVIAEIKVKTTSQRMKELLQDEARALRRQMKALEKEKGTNIGGGVGGLQILYEKFSDSKVGGKFKNLIRGAFGEDDLTPSAGVRGRVAPFKSLRQMAEADSEQARAGFSQEIQKLTDPEEAKGWLLDLHKEMERARKSLKKNPDASDYYNDIRSTYSELLNKFNELRTKKYQASEPTTVTGEEEITKAPTYPGTNRPIKIGDRVRIRDESKVEPHFEGGLKGVEGESFSEFLKRYHYDIKDWSKIPEHFTEKLVAAYEKAHEGFKTKPEKYDAFGYRTEGYKPPTPSSEPFARGRVAPFEPSESRLGRFGPKGKVEPFKPKGTNIGSGFSSIQDLYEKYGPKLRDATARRWASLMDDLDGSSDLEYKNIMPPALRDAALGPGETWKSRFLAAIDKREAAATGRATEAPAQVETSATFKSESGRTFTEAFRKDPGIPGPVYTQGVRGDYDFSMLDKEIEIAADNVSRLRNIIEDARNRGDEAKVTKYWEEFQDARILDRELLAAKQTFSMNPEMGKRLGYTGKSFKEVSNEIRTGGKTHEELFNEREAAKKSAAEERASRKITNEREQIEHDYDAKTYEESHVREGKFEQGRDPKYRAENIATAERIFAGFRRAIQLAKDGKTDRAWEFWNDSNSSWKDLTNIVDSKSKTYDTFNELRKSAWDTVQAAEKGDKGTFAGSGLGALQEFYERLTKSKDPKAKTLLAELKASAWHLYSENGVPVKGFASKAEAEGKAAAFNNAMSKRTGETVTPFYVKPNTKGVAGVAPPKPVVEATEPIKSSAKKPEDIAPEDKFDPTSLLSTLKGMDRKARKVVEKVASQFEHKDRPPIATQEINKQVPVDMNTPMGRFMQRLRDNTKAEAVRAFDLKAWRAAKANKIRAIAEEGPGGEKGHILRKAAMKGTLDAPMKFKPLDMPQYAIDELINASDKFYKGDVWAQGRAADAIRSLDMGQYIPPSQRALISNMFPEPALRSEMMNLYSNLPWEHIGKLAEPVRGLVHNLAAGGFRWTYGSTTTLKAALDASFMLIQARGALHTKAFRSAVKPMLKAFRRQSAFDAQQLKRINDPWYRILEEDMGIHFGDLEKSKLEQFAGGNPTLESSFVVKPFHRAAISFLNHIRFENGKLFHKLAEKRGGTADLYQTHTDAKGNVSYPKLESIGRAVNEMTGHGSLSEHYGIPQAAKFLSHGLWSTRLTASRINMLKLLDYREYAKPNRFAQKQRALSAVSMVATSLALMKLFETLGGKGNWDPTSGKFGKSEMPDGQLVDTTGGYGSLVTLVARILSGKVTNSKDKTTDLYGGEYKAQSATDLIKNYLENKMNPKLSYTTKLIDQVSPYTGKPYNIPAETAGLVTPLFIENIFDSLYGMAKGDKDIRNLFLLLPGFAGINMYEGDRNKPSLPEFALSPVVKPKPKYTLRRNIEDFARDVVR